jgi:predicted TIM-barrel fold metal-dependent hydrolase
MHVFGPPEHYKGSSDRMYTPVDMPMSAYDREVGSLGFDRLVFVQPSAYGTDNSCLFDAMKQRPDTTRAIVVIDPATGEDELREMDKAGARGIRLNLKTPRHPDTKAHQGALEHAAAQIGKFGWHIQVYADTGMISALAPAIRKLRVPLVLDHMSGVKSKDGPKQPDFDIILDLISSGACWAKVSGADIVSGLTGNDVDLWDAAPFAQALIAANANQVVWGTDWPHPAHMHGTIGEAAAQIVFRPVGNAALVTLFLEAAGEDATRSRILVDNPQRLYGF